MSQVLCRLTDIPDGEATGFTVTLDDAPTRILVARKGATVYGYVNRCPHAGTPLDWQPDRFMTFDLLHLKCFTHGARFDVETGICVSGAAFGTRLRPVAVAVDPDGMVVLLPQIQGLGTEAGLAATDFQAGEA